RPKPVVHVHPDKNVFRGEKVTLTCDIQQTRDWWYIWHKDGNRVSSTRRDKNYMTISSVDWSHSGVYSCDGSQSKAPHYSEYSDEVTLTVSDLPTSALTVISGSPVFTGDTVNLTCVIESYSNWRYEWYKGNTNNRVMLQTSDHYTVNKDTHTIRGVNESDQYWCRGRPQSSHFSSAVHLYVK
ncbi:hypothetical protein M9458_052715, partial [Cirrhinus mrigala]